MPTWAQAREAHEGICILAIHSCLAQARFVCGVSGQVICTQWEAEISFPHEISE